MFLGSDRSDIYKDYINMYIYFFYLFSFEGRCRLNAQKRVKTFPGMASLNVNGRGKVKYVGSRVT